MAEKNIQIKNLAGDLLFPKTKGAVVINNAGANLGGVEAGAQVNKIETIKLNGVALAIADKAVNVELPAAVEYTIAKAEAADEGFAATYQLAKDGVAFGTKINIPKDMVVEAGTLKKCVEENKPVAGLAVNDPYIELTIANGTGDKIYIPVKDLVDVYTAANATVTITGNKIAVNIEELKKTFAVAADVTTELGKKLDKATYDEDKKTFAIAADVTAELAKKVDKATYATDKAALERDIAAKVAQATYDEKMAALDAEDAKIREDFAAADTALDTAYKAADAALDAAYKAADTALDTAYKAADTALGKRIDACLLYEELA